MRHQIRYLLWKEWLLEWRMRYAINGVLLYLFSSLFVTYLSVKGVISPDIWNALFWIILLFTAVNAVSKSFVTESEQQQLYYYTLASPQALILSKMIYNVVLMLFLGVVFWLGYQLLFGTPVRHVVWYFAGVGSGVAGMASVLTLTSGIASRAGKNFSLMAILSFPLVMPLLLISIRLTGLTLHEVVNVVSLIKLLGALLCINGVVVLLAVLLFPFLWTD